VTLAVIPRGRWLVRDSAYRPRRQQAERRSISRAEAIAAIVAEILPPGHDIMSASARS
jgi:hypothetical protein